MNIAAILFAGLAAAQSTSPNWGQCGGSGWNGPRVCNPGWVCTYLNQWHSQCLAAPTPPTVECTNPVNVAQGSGGNVVGGGTAGSTVVTTCDALRAAAQQRRVVIRISGMLAHCGVVDVSQSSTIIGVGNNSGLVDGGLRMRSISGVSSINQVLVRNLKFHRPPRGNASLSIESAGSIVIDHNEFRNDGIHGDKDAFGPQVEIIHGSSLVTISWNVFRDHWRGSSVRQNSRNGAPFLTTFHNNFWSNIDSETPSVRDSAVHVFSSCFENIPTSGIDLGQEGWALVENNRFINVTQAIATNLDAVAQGFTTERNNIFNNSSTAITQTGHVAPTYGYGMEAASCICDRVRASAGVGVLNL
ncbi:hypothetical protein S40285_08896 [Stachybotrys chlorohalonatus IBT 40285]|uniref:CBM1 domain-containing protein n=1 Tax=Stachybotrys chlorohalonatus (strain IBT 40285) TaxID=1283841 RepID=A0A084QZJ3_STAC4|nr:hypothetical protein S40285_08896 [Stachybotrys chlorohalonata IBT 40285]